jgi:hypothetical protein
MPKGGARKKSDDFPIGKGMLQNELWETLCFAADRKSFSPDNVREYFSKESARFEPKIKGTENPPTETARAYCKELWRCKLIEKVCPRCKFTLEISIPTWGGRGRNFKYNISKLGRDVVGKGQHVFPLIFAKLVLDAKDGGIFPQCDKIFRLHDKIGTIPVSETKRVTLTKQHVGKVEKHAGKSLCKGVLEACGIIYAKTKDDYTINDTFVTFLQNTSIDDIYPKTVYLEKINDQNICIKWQKKDLGLNSFEDKKRIEFNLKIQNKTQNNITVNFDHKLNSIFEKISKLTYQKQYQLTSGEQKDDVSFVLESKAKKQLPNSIMATFIGTLTVKLNGSLHKIFLPTIECKTDDNVWEAEICELFKKLGLRAFHLKGGSDRPDAVIDLSCLTKEPPHHGKYMTNGIKKKLMMETTLNDYDYNKLKKDAKKFISHKTKVIKINAVGQIIVAQNKFKITREKLKDVQNKHKHSITLIDKDSLEHLISKKPPIKKLKELLVCEKRITKELVDSIFPESK